MSKFKALLTWLLAIAISLLCLVAGRWQFDKGITISHRNRDITSKSLLAPEPNPYSIDTFKDQWRKFQIDGEFLFNYELVRNQYENGQFGFHVLQEFKSKSLGLIQIDRGWVKAGANASTPPLVPEVAAGPDRLILRLRSEFLNRQLGGSLFALPAKYLNRKIAYYDLISGQVNQPLTFISLPELSTGPHFAYAIQWLFFAILILVARALFYKKIKP